jgi:hypothetical protein
MAETRPPSDGMPPSDSGVAPAMAEVLQAVASETPVEVAANSR